MKYLFLDIDGVLNNGTGPFLHEDKVKLLSEIIEETNAKIILVSSWKDGWYNDKSLCTARAKIIDSVFEKFGIFIYDKTEDNNSWQRGKGINDFLKEHFAEKWIVLDDENFPDYKEYCNGHIVFTKFKSGLTEKEKTEAINLLM